MKRYDLVVIGGGSAGLTAARTAGRLAPARCSSNATGWAATACGRGAYRARRSSTWPPTSRPPAAPLPTVSRR